MSDRSHPKSQSLRLQSLDLLRGMAIFLVFLNHIEPRTVSFTKTLSGGTLSFLYWRVKNLGWTGVDLFFVLSGFLISGLLFREMEKTGSLNCWKFWLRRGLKIWPSYFFLLFVLAITDMTQYIDYSSLRSACLSFLCHFLFLQNYLSSNPNGPTWSLAVEEHFYILLPLAFVGILSLSKKTGRQWQIYIPKVAATFMIVCLGLRVVQSVVGIAPNDHMKTHFRMDALMYGVYINYLCISGSSTIKWIQLHKTISMGIAIVCISPAMWLSRSHPLMFTAGFSLLSFGYGILLILMYGGLLRAYQAARPAVFLSSVGKWSYNVYLWHYFVIAFPIYYMLDNVLIRLLGSPILMAIGQGTLFIAFGIAVGFLVY